MRGNYKIMYFILGNSTHDYYLNPTKHYLIINIDNYEKKVVNGRDIMRMQDDGYMFCNSGESLLSWILASKKCSGTSNTILKFDKDLEDLKISCRYLTREKALFIAECNNLVAYSIINFGVKQDCISFDIHNIDKSDKKTEVYCNVVFSENDSVLWGVIVDFIVVIEKGKLSIDTNYKDLLNRDFEIKENSATFTNMEAILGKLMFLEE